MGELPGLHVECPLHNTVLYREKLLFTSQFFNSFFISSGNNPFDQNPLSLVAKCVMHEWLLYHLRVDSFLHFSACLYRKLASIDDIVSEDDLSCYRIACRLLSFDI